MMVSDTVVRARCEGVPVIVTYFSTAGTVRNVLLGTRIGGCNMEHNIRIQGAHSAIFSNIFVELNTSVDDNTPGTGFTLRPFGSGGGEAPNGTLHDFTKDPTDFSDVSNIMRTGTLTQEYVNRHVVVIDSIFGLPNPLPESSNGFLLDFGGLFSQAYGNVYNDIVGDSPLRDIQIWGQYITIRNIDYSETSDSQVGISRNWYADDCSLSPAYNCSADVHLEGNPDRNAFTGDLPELSVPSSSWR